VAPANPKSLNLRRVPTSDVTTTTLRTQFRWSSPRCVAAAVRELFTTAWPSRVLDKVAVAFEDFDKLLPAHAGLHGVRTTLTHDRQHSLDMTLAMARLWSAMSGRLRADCAFGGRAAGMALVTFGFHDAGYIRKFDDRQHSNGAEFTLYHVTRRRVFLAAQPAEASAWKAGCRLRHESSISPVTRFKLI